MIALFSKPSELKWLPATVIKAAAALLGGILLPLILFCLLPFLGFDWLANLLSWKQIGLLSLLLIGGTSYWYFIDFIRIRPRFLLFSLLILHPWLSFISITLNDFGINNYYTAWIFVL